MKRNTQEDNILFFQQNYPEILKMVNNGFTIRQALSKINFCSTLFYRLASEEQKEEIKTAKMRLSALSRAMEEDYRDIPFFLQAAVGTSFTMQFDGINSISSEHNFIRRNGLGEGIGEASNGYSLYEPYPNRGPHQGYQTKKDWEEKEIERIKKETDDFWENYNEQMKCLSQGKIFKSKKLREEERAKRIEELRLQEEIEEDSLRFFQKLNRGLQEIKRQRIKDAIRLQKEKFQIQKEEAERRKIPSGTLMFMTSNELFKKAVDGIKKELYIMVSDKTTDRLFFNENAKSYLRIISPNIYTNGHRIKCGSPNVRTYEFVQIFSPGKIERIVFEFAGLELGEPNAEWCENWTGEPVFIIKLGKIVK